MGDPHHTKTAYGSIPTQEEINGLRSEIQSAKAGGGSILLGGGSYLNVDQNNVMEPTIILEPPTRHPLWGGGEVCGPLVMIKVVDTIESAVEMSNGPRNLPPMLSCSIFSNHRETALALASEIRAVEVHIGGEASWASRRHPLEATVGHGIGGSRFARLAFSTPRCVVLNTP